MSETDTGGEVVRRGEGGRFLPGTKGGPGNPNNQASMRFRAKMLECVTEADFAAVVRVLVNRAKDGEPWAVKELLDRTMGKQAAFKIEDDGDGPRSFSVVIE